MISNAQRRIVHDASMEAFSFGATGRRTAQPETGVFTDGNLRGFVSVNPKIPFALGKSRHR